jgi:ubiquinone/menaquinone biosynthesis C-methylase UbiE
MSNNEKHVIDCESALKCWASRRAGDTKGNVIAHQNIQAVLARQGALFECLYFMESELCADFSNFEILDVGSASGYGLTPFLIAGFSMNQLNGIDLFEERINLGRNKYPGMKLNIGDATKMDIFKDNQFDMTMEQFCFCHVEDDNTVERIAKQMLRVTKPDGYILIMDWQIGSKKAHYNGISQKKIKSMFEAGLKTEIIKRFPSQLSPPIGRFFSKYFPSLYPLIAVLFPFLVLSHLTLIKCKKY